MTNTEVHPKSPLTGGETNYIRSIPSSDIIRWYAPYCDVHHYFLDIPQVKIYECRDTGYRFYYPYSVAGDGAFYQALAEEKLYYVPWKEEHEVAASYIKTGDIVFEMGCGTGDFLIEMSRRKSIKAFGTEINPTAQATARARGVNFSPVENADVTCAFQVLEHISDVRSFIHEAIAATKPGGYIIFGVPNNDSFIDNDPTGFLNMPPHHMGLWNESSLRAIASHFSITYLSSHKETLRPYHYRYWYQVKFGDRIKKLGFPGKVINKVIYELLFRFIISLRAPKIIGHTIIAIYKKSN
jgi:SAM-dependent methyltransferase